MRLRVRFLNRYRRNDSLQWYLENGSLLRAIAVRDSVVADSLTFAASGEAGIVRIRIRIVDSAGTTWNYQDSLNVKKDAPRAFAGKDTVLTVGDTLRLIGSASDSLGSLIRLEWDEDASGRFTVSPDGSHLLVASGAPDSLQKAIFRATDDDGNTTADTIGIRLIGYRILAPRPVLPHSRSARPFLNLPLIAAQGRIFAFGGSVLDPFGAWTEYQRGSGEWVTRATAPFSGLLSVVADRIFLTDDSRLYEYDPAADAWIASATPIIRGRKDISFATIPTVVHEGRLYRMGGISDGGAPLSAVEIFDPATGSWSAGQDAPTGGDVLPFSLAGKIYLAARSDSSLNAYDPGTDRWTAAGHLPSGGKRLIPMGTSGSKAVFLEEASATMRIFDAGENAWTQDALPAGIGAIAYSAFLDGWAAFESLPQGVLAAFSARVQTAASAERFRIALYDAAQRAWRDLPSVYPEPNQSLDRVSLVSAGSNRIHMALFKQIFPERGYPKADRLAARPRFLEYFLP